MRIVAVADTHLFTDGFVVPDGDVFVHAGDLCRRGDLQELGEAMDWIASLPHRTKIVIAGNHDVAFENDPDAARALVPSSVTYLQDASAVVDGVHFYGSPWVAAFGGWAFNLPTADGSLAAKWGRIPAGVDVLITHGPPFGFGDPYPKGEGHLGCPALLARVRQVRPRLHLYGHIHAGGGVRHDGDIVTANVTTWECSRAATVFDYDASSRDVQLDTEAKGDERAR